MEDDSNLKDSHQFDEPSILSASLSQPCSSTSVPIPSNIDLDEGPAQRLIITKLVLNNFKSYAGERVIGPFHKSFTAIVGPNGSGKSNVIDALLFVFGFKSRKIRQDKVAQLIHRSENFLSLPECSVAIHFQMIRDAGEGYEIAGWSDTPVAKSRFYSKRFTSEENPELIVSRKATSDGKSSYSINDQHATQRDVKDLLLELGIDLINNRFLILQGEVENISLMKPIGDGPNSPGLLEYIEEIIGSNIFKEGIEASQKEMEIANENKVAMLTQVKAAEKDLVSLENPKGEAVEYLLKSGKVYDLQAELCQMRTARETRRLAAVSTKIEELQAVLQTKQQQNEGDLQRLKEMEAQLKTLEAQHSQLSGALATVVQESKELEKQKIKQGKEITFKKRKRTELEKLLSGNETTISAKLSEVDQNVQRRLQKKDIIDRCTRELAEVEALIEDIKKRTQEKSAPLHVRVGELQKELAPWQQQILDAQSRCDVSSEEIDILEAKANEAATKLQHAEAQLQDVSQRLESLTAEEIPDWEGQLAQAQQKISSTNDYLGKLNPKIEEIEKFLHLCHEKSAEIIEQLAPIEQQGQVSRSKVFSTIMNAKKERAHRDHLRGVCGVLGELGIIDKKFDVALSTSVGNAFQQIVVEDAATAQYCLDFLRKTKAGTATFILLDKVTPQYQSNVSSSSSSTTLTSSSSLSSSSTSTSSLPYNGDVPAAGLLLRDLIIPRDPKYLAAFWHVVRDTLVASDLDSASRLAYDGRTRRRVISLNGDLFDPSGTLTGGKTTSVRGVMKSSWTEVPAPVDAGDLAERQEEQRKKLEQIQAKIKERTALLEDSRVKKDTRERELDKLERFVAKLKADLAKGHMNVQSMEKEKQHLHQQLPVLRAATSQLDQSENQRLASLKQALAASQAELQAARAGAASIEEELSLLKDKIATAGGLPLMQAKSKEESLTVELDQANQVYNQAGVAIKTAEKTKQQLEAESARAKGELDGLCTQLAALEQEHSALLERMQELNRQVTQLTGDEMTASESLSVERERYAAINNDIEAARTEEVNLTNQLEDKLREQRDGQTRCKKLEQELQQLDLQKQDLNLSSLIDPEPQQEAHHPDHFRLKILSPEEIQQAFERGYDGNHTKQSIEQLRQALSKMSPNMSAIEDYRRKRAILNEKQHQLDALAVALEEGRSRYEDLRRQRSEMFLAGFTMIQLKLKEMYQLLTRDGDAELEFVDNLDPFCAGILFFVRPPKKSWKTVSNLSGGEKTLSSLALIFALHHFRPTPLYVMDEIDAALDFRNVDIVAKYVQHRTKNAQFIIISLRNHMFEPANRLVGIYKTHNCTKSVTIDPKQFHIPSIPTPSSSAAEPDPEQSTNHSVISA